MVAQLLSLRTLEGNGTSTEHGLVDGAGWWGPAATLTVIVALPLALAVTVTTEPETLTEATVGALEVAVILPSPSLVTVMVSVVFAAVSLMEVLFKDKLPVALAILQATVLAPVLPSANLSFVFGVKVTL